MSVGGAEYKDIILESNGPRSTVVFGEKQLSLMACALLSVMDLGAGCTSGVAPLLWLLVGDGYLVRVAKTGWGVETFPPESTL